MYAFCNKNWAYLLKAFNVKNLDFPEQISQLQKTILLISDDKLKEIEHLRKKVEENEVVIIELPGTKNSSFNKKEIEFLLSKALGIISK